MDKLSKNVVKLEKVDEKQVENEQNYLDGVAAFKNSNFKDALETFNLLGNYKDSKEYVFKIKIILFNNARDEFEKFPLLKSIYKSEDYLAKELDEKICSQLNELLSDSNAANLNLDAIYKTFNDMFDMDGSEEYLFSCKKAEMYIEFHKNDCLYNQALNNLNSGRYSDAKSQFMSLGSFKDSNKKADECQKRYEEKAARDRAIREEMARQKEKSDKRKTIFQVIAYSLPILLTVVFAIILFANARQLSIKGSFGGWITAWIFFLIGTIVTSIIFFRKRFNYWKPSDKASKVSAIVMASISLFCSIVVFANCGKLERHFNPANDISLRATSKEVYSRGSYIITKIDFTVTNHSSVDVTSFYGQMDFYKNNSYIATWNVTFNGDYYSGSSKNVYVEFEEYYNTDLAEISYSSLGISYSISEMQFNGQYRVFEFKGDSFRVK